MTHFLYMCPVHVRFLYFAHDIHVFCALVATFKLGRTHMHAIRTRSLISWYSRMHLHICTYMFLHTCMCTILFCIHLTSMNPGSLFIEIKKVIFPNTIDTTPHAHCTVVWFSTNIRHCWTSSSHDKYTRHRWKQTTLFLSAILGGSLGGSLDDMRVCSNECKDIWNIKITVIEKTTVRKAWSVYSTIKSNCMRTSLKMIQACVHFDRPSI